MGEVPDDIPANAIVALRFHPAWRGVVALDQFQQTIVLTREPAWGPAEAPAAAPVGGAPRAYPRAWTDSDSERFRAWIRREPYLSIKLGRDAVDGALLVASEANPIDPPRAWLDGLAWDGVSRVGAVPLSAPAAAAPSAAQPATPDAPRTVTHPGSPSWLTTYLGVADTPYTRRVGRWMLVGAVARIYRPGCKLDNALVLEGPQGAFKSTALRVLFDPWFSDTPIDLTSKDRFSAIQGVWGYELAEFDGYSRLEAHALKQWASSPSDKYRPPYMRRDQTIPRRGVFAATINPGKEYLQDETGGRRWWPVKVAAEHAIDIDALRRDREQIWAESRLVFESGEAWHPQTDEEHADCRVQQAARQAGDAWEDKIRRWVSATAEAPARERVTVGEVLDGALKIEPARWDKAAQMRVGTCLRALGYTRKHVWIPEAERAPGASTHRYVYERADVDGAGTEPAAAPVRS